MSVHCYRILLAWQAPCSPTSPSRSSGSSSTSRIPPTLVYTRLIINTHFFSWYPRGSRKKSFFLLMVLPLFFTQKKFRRPLSSRGGGGKALMARPLKKTFLSGFPSRLVDIWPLQKLGVWRLKKLSGRFKMSFGLSKIFQNLGCGSLKKASGRL